MDNPFEFHEEDGIIACVGDNGGTTDDDIRNGFKRTVEILIKSLKVSQEVEDLLVYPIVYNARHHCGQLKYFRKISEFLQP